MDIKNLFGTVKHIIFQSADESFAVARFETKDRNITIVGPLYGIKREQELRIWGQEKRHPKYGLQIQVSHFETPLPSEAEQIVNYLSSSIKNVGKKRAQAIVDKLGKGALKTIIEHGPSTLKDIKGINEKLANAIYRYLVDNLELQYVLSALLPYGLTATMAMRAYQAWGFNAINVVQENPYLLGEIGTIGFFKADLIAKNLGFREDNSYRLQGAIKHLLLEAENNGHCFLPKEELLQKSQELLKQKGEDVQEKHEEALELLLANRLLVLEKERVYLPRLHEGEERVIEKVKELCWTKPFVSIDRVQKYIDQFEMETNLELAEEQKKAIEAVFQRGLCILTGGPGTGKTLTVNGVIYVLKKIFNQPRILLASPTGRASQNLAEITGEEAGTIHRLLGFRPGEGPEYNERETLDCELLVIDEASMLDINLAGMVFEAIDPMKTRVLLVGDADQLPSVGPGNVLHDLIEGGVPAIRLKEIFRQEETSQIITNAHRVNKGEMIQIVKEKEDFYFLEQEEPENIAQLIKVVALRFIEQGYSLKELQVLAPMHKGSVGTIALNSLLQEALNPPHPKIIQTKIGDTLFREGDRVMQLRNNYDKEVFNGEVGFISKIIPAEKEKPLSVLVEFRGEIMEYTYDEAFEELSLAYCMTVHKAQGGEVPIIIMPISNQHYFMLARNLLYTGITRAKEKVVLIGTKSALIRAITNDRTTKRYTSLAEKLEQILAS